MRVPKPNHKRRAPKQSVRNKFSKKVAQEIIDRDDGICQICFSMSGTEIHHIKFRSQGGRGVATNGILLCPHCHRLAHKEWEVAESLRLRAKNKYGPDYYKDRRD